jgi:hypothetical protein
MRYQFTVPLSGQLDVWVVASNEDAASRILETVLADGAFDKLISETVQRRIDATLDEMEARE